MRLLLIILFVGSIQASAQILNVGGVANVPIRERKLENISGSPYVFEDWLPGTLKGLDGSEYNNLFLKYDAYKDRLEMNKEGETYEITASLYSEFTLSRIDPQTKRVATHRFRSGFSASGLPPKAFLEVLSDGDYSLLKRLSVAFLEQAVTNYGSTTVEKRYDSKIKYFVVTPEKTLREVKLSKKSVLEVLPEKAEEIEAISSKSKLKLKSENDLVLLISALSSH